LILKTLRLKNFRRFSTFKTDFHSAHNVIEGRNGSGKSSVLEAIHLLFNLRSPWTAANTDLMGIAEQQSYFRIEATVERDDEDTELVLFQDTTQTKLQINGKNVSRKKFAEIGLANIFSPEQIDILMLSPTKRREFIDEIACNIDQDYSTNLAQMQKVLRQRNAHLKKLSKLFYEQNILQTEDQQLHFWNIKLAEFSAFVIMKRLSIIEELNKLLKDLKLEYCSTIKLSDFGELLGFNELMRLHKKQLDDNVKRDIATGFTNIGAHRDDWTLNSKKLNGLMVNEKNTTFDVKKFASRGEKRFNIGKIILALQELYFKNLGYYPILLLDDISSELDSQNLKNFYKLLKPSKQQIIECVIKDNLDVTVNQHKA